MPSLRSLKCISIVLLFLIAGRVDDARSEVRLDKKEDRVSVYIDDELFTEYIFEGYEKPILYPVIGAHGIGMTRNWPMKEGAPHEAKDHPHHKSIWFGHMKVNGESFWHSGDTAGTTEPVDLTVDDDTIKCSNRLVGRDGKLIAKDDREIRFSHDGTTRFIDYSVTYHASEGDVEFGDDKDGQMGIRMNPYLRLKGPVANGQVINSEGVGADNIWGKRAKWIDYWGKIDDHVVGIAVFDHPSNFRYPTWWHARDYGLLSANPFGIHHFENKEEGAGNHVLPKGESLTFKHRFVIHQGDYQEARIEQRFVEWSQE